MKKIYIFIISIILSLNLISQDKNLLDYDECKDEINTSLLKKYEKALEYFNDKKYSNASSLLQSILQENENFASAYFLMGMIGVVKDNTKMIMKYFPLVKQTCTEFSHPYLYYYLGMIDYTEEKYEQAAKNFETFLSLTDGNNFYDSLQNVAINYIDWSTFLHQTMENKVEFNLSKINFLAKNMNYYEPFITWNEDEIYFIREHIEQSIDRGSFLSNIQTIKQNFLQRSQKDSSGFYDKGFILDSPFNDNLRQSGVSITADNNYVFFSLKNNNGNNNDTWDIYYCQRIEDYFSNAKPLNINTELYDEFSPSISADGNTLYFVSNRSGGKGGYDIWTSNRIGKDTWSEPANMGNNVNTFADETYPFIAIDNQKLYFLSNGRKTLGGSDIFYYDISSNKQAINIGYPINTEMNERGIGVLADGKTAYSVLKNKDNDFYEINKFQLPENARNNPKILVNVAKKKTLEGDIVLQLYCIDDMELTQYYSENIYDSVTLIIDENKTYILSLQQNGYMFFARKITNENDKNLVVYQYPLESNSSMKLEDIKYLKNNGGFDDISMKILDEFVSFLKINQRVRIVLSANDTILLPIQEYLIKSGIRQDRIQTQQINSNKIIYTIQ